MAQGRGEEGFRQGQEDRARVAAQGPRQEGSCVAQGPRHRSLSCPWSTGPLMSCPNGLAAAGPDPLPLQTLIQILILSPLCPAKWTGTL